MHDHDRKPVTHLPFNPSHDPTQAAQVWFQESTEGHILFVVFYTQACRWSRCLGCNLPRLMSPTHISCQYIIAQIDNLFQRPDVLARRMDLRKVIVSNNGSVLDQETFSSTALMYLMARLNLNFPNLSVVTLETRPEYVEFAELEFLSRALAEGDTPTQLELAIGFEAFDDRIRNDIFNKGLPLRIFQRFVRKTAAYKFNLKVYFMLKPVPGMTNSQAVEDVHKAIEYLSALSDQFGIRINMHLNPTYVARGTFLEEKFRSGEYTPPGPDDIVQAVLPAEHRSLSIFIGLDDEGLAVEGGSFLREGDVKLVALLEEFNRTQDYSILKSFQ